MLVRADVNKPALDDCALADPNLPSLTSYTSELAGGGTTHCFIRAI